MMRKMTDSDILLPYIAMSYVRRSFSINASGMDEPDTDVSFIHTVPITTYNINIFARKARIRGSVFLTHNRIMNLSIGLVSQCVV